MRVPFPVRRTCTLSGRATRYVASRPYQARDESTTDGVARPAMTMGIVLLIACLAAETTGSPMATMTIDMQPDQLSEEFGNAQTVARGLPPVAFQVATVEKGDTGEPRARLRRDDGRGWNNGENTQQRYGDQERGGRRDGAPMTDHSRQRDCESSGEAPWWVLGS